MRGSIILALFQGDIGSCNGRGGPDNVITLLFNCSPFLLRDFSHSIRSIAIAVSIDMQSSPANHQGAGSLLARA